ncbi:hypothetical protein N7519_004114 [Penicillium mononematosum]|uniref:uncharacterized protein n=1 Tax=Penicillium mononematosum TaxID=268346 RepID=UPI0025477788|nr:uncharacterized protein N7519_004114 [Penicillium mononematosum]KAJ6189206.1 hypothetical protein N7519_004114 [Penicillium mononematosum]
MPPHPNPAYSPPGTLGRQPTTFIPDQSRVQADNASGDIGSIPARAARGTDIAAPAMYLWGQPIATQLY